MESALWSENLEESTCWTPCYKIKTYYFQCLPQKRVNIRRAGLYLMREEKRLSEWLKIGQGDGFGGHTMSRKLKGEYRFTGILSLQGDRRRGGRGPGSAHCVGWSWAFRLQLATCPLYTKLRASWASYQESHR